MRSTQATQTQHHNSEEKLVEAAKSGDQAAFARLYTLYTPRLYARLSRLTGPGRHLEDLLQQIFMELHKSLPSFRGDCQISTYLTRITIHIAAQHLRTRKRKPPLELGLEGQDPRLAQDAGEPDHLAIVRAWRMLDELKPELRMVLVLRDVEELTFEEIAAATESPLSTVVSRLQRARELLARMLRRGKP